MSRPLTILTPVHARVVAAVDAVVCHTCVDASREAGVERDPWSEPARTRVHVTPPSELRKTPPVKSPNVSV